MLHQFELTAEIWRLIDSCRCGIAGDLKKKKNKNSSYTLSTKTQFFRERLPSDSVIHLRLCSPGHWRSLGYEGQEWWLHKCMMRLPFCLVLLHVSVSLWPSELKPRKPSEARSVWHCHYWTTYNCCGLQDWKQKEIMFLFLISERQRDCAHIYWKWNDPWKMADPSIKSGNCK